MVTAEDTAMLLALMLTRSGKTRGRISDRTLRVISRRKQLRDAFRSSVVEWAPEYGFQMHPLERGGYGLLASKTLEGAPPLTAASLIKEEMTTFKRSGTFDYETLYEELGVQFDESDE